MDSFSAMLRGQAAQGQPLMVFDWDEAARRIKASGVKSASAGLESDWEYTGGSIFEDGKPIPGADTYVYLASLWATPELDLGEGPEPCWKYAAGTGWDAHTFWPESARKILEAT